MCVCVSECERERESVYVCDCGWGGVGSSEKGGGVELREAKGQASVVSREEWGRLGGS